MKPSSIFRLFMVALLVMGAASDVDAQKKRARSRTTTAAVSPAVAKGAVKTYGDGLTTQLFSIRKGESKIVVEYPIAGTPAIVNPLRKQIARWIVGQDLASRFSSLETPEQMLKYEIKKYASKGKMGMTGETKEEKIVVSYSDSKVITINSTGYLYSGGAHGMDWDVSATFLLANGSRLTASMLPSFSVLRPYILKGIAAYLDCSVSDLGEYITLDGLEYPSSDPYITAKGLTFCYGSYEIGPYSIGMPQASIPLSTVRPLCSGAILKFM